MIRGTLTEFSLPELIRFVSETHKTGVLEITGPSGRGELLFLDGCVCGVRAGAAREPLGRKLVRAKALSEPQLWRALDARAHSHQRLGQVLIAHGATTLEQVQSALREQIEDMAVEILSRGPTEFQWRSDPPEEQNPVLIPPDNFLSAVSERMQEVERIRARVDTPGSVVSINPSPPGDPADLQISRAEWRMLSLLGARRSVEGLTQYSGSGDIHTLRALDRLIEGGLIEIGPSPAASVATVNADRASRRPPPDDQIIRLTDRGSPSITEPFTIAIVATSNRPQSLLGAAILRKAAAGLPVHVLLLRLDDLGPVAPSAEALLQAEELGVDLTDHPSRQLRRGELSHCDLVIGLDWWHVDRAVLYGGAPRERAFTGVELLALTEKKQVPDEPRMVVRARRLVEQAHDDRVLDSEKGRPSTATDEHTANQALESWSRLAHVLFSTESVREIS